MKPFRAEIGALGAALLLIALLAVACGAPAPTAAPTPPQVATIALPTQPPAPTATTAPAVPTAVPPMPTTAPSPRPTVAAHPGQPLVSFVSKFFTGAGNCAACHTGISDAAGKDVSFDTQLRPSMMANSARDPYWQAQVEAEVARFPELQAVIEGNCVVCHMPMAHTEAAAMGEPSPVLGDGFLNPNHPLHKAAMDGSSCTLCHQMQPTNLGTAASFTGGFVIDTALEVPNRPAFGAFADQHGQVMVVSVGYTPLQGLHMTQSEMCATCHTLYTPYVDAQGNVVGEFPEQTPYLEWKHSDFGDGVGTDMQCQECHMPTAQGNVPLATVPRNLPARAPVRQHAFVGPNTVMLKMHQANVAELGLTASTANLGQALIETETLLQEHTAHIAIADASVAGDTLNFTVVVENRAGHKFPSSFPSRRAWIHLTVTDANGRIVFESGKPQDDGSIVGCDADLDVRAYEPHYDLITSPDQVQIYEPILGDTDGQVTYTLLRGAVYLKDNRLLPLGFDKTSAQGDIAIHGSAADDGNFVGGSDRVTYRVSATGFARPFQVSADLLYQAVSYRFAEDLRGETGPLSQRFMRLWDEADKSAALVATAKATVP